jgi:hypothetical protein
MMVLVQWLLQELGPICLGNISYSVLLGPQDWSSRSIAFLSCPSIFSSLISPWRLSLVITASNSLTPKPSLSFLYLKHYWVWMKSLSNRKPSYPFLASKLPWIEKKPNRKALSIIYFENAWSGESACFLFVWLRGPTPGFIKLDFIYFVIHPSAACQGYQWLILLNIQNHFTRW